MIHCSFTVYLFSKSEASRLGSITLVRRFFFQFGLSKKSLLQITLDFDPMFSDSYDLCLSSGWDNAPVATQKDRVRSGRPAMRSMAVKHWRSYPSRAFLPLSIGIRCLVAAPGPTKLEHTVEPKCERRTRGKQEEELCTAFSMPRTAFWHGVILSAICHAKNARV
jgi:hypothetical protein